MTNSAFEEVISQLNEAQRQAVNQIEGPVLVIAGPGTGKTQILSARIGKILMDTDAQPYNILCLTYTDAGTVAMRERLVKFIGPDAYKVHIHTFHSFCNMVIQENGQYFGRREMQAISDLELIDVLHELIDGFDNNHILKKYTGDVYMMRKQLKSQFDLMKQENWTSEFIISKIEEILPELPFKEEYRYQRKYTDSKTGRQYQKGDLKEKEIAKAHEIMAKLKAAAIEFDNYNKLLVKKRRYDFQDMIRWVVEAFDREEFLLLRYQEQFQYILVDEFQDTNGAQNQIVQLLASYWEQESPNVFVVGDDDQAIYRFQGANVENIRKFRNKYANVGLTEVYLTENYRSTQTILNAAKAVIDNNTDRLVNDGVGLDKTLKAALPAYLDEGKPVQVVEYQNTWHQDADIVKQIELLREQGENLNEIAIIYHVHKEVNNIIRVLEHRKIPFNAKKGINVLEEPLILKLLTILQYLYEETDRTDTAEYLLFELMHFDFFKVDVHDVAAIVRECRSNKIPWRLVIGSPEKLFRLGLYKASTISKLSQLLTQWLEYSQNLILQELLEKILLQSGIYAVLMKLPEKEKLWQLQVLTSFFDFLKAESERLPRLSIGDFLETIKKMNDNGLIISTLKIYKAEPGIKLITAHSSKGLEFKHVFMINCVQDNWEKKASPSLEFSLPDNIDKEVKENKIEETRRLFYVAITRAKQHLHLGYSLIKYNKDNKEKETSVSLYIQEILDKLPIKIQQRALDNVEMAEYTIQTLLPPDISGLTVEKTYIDEVLKNFRLSASALNKYLACPLAFYFEYILHVPTAKNPSMGFGSAIHYALENFFRLMQKNQDQFPAKEELLSLFDKGMIRYYAQFTEKDFKYRSEYGHKLLPELYDQYVNRWAKIVSIEYNVNQAAWNGIPLTGKIDKVEFPNKNNECNVVDYKTGQPDNYKTKEKLNKPDHKNPLGGDYWRQIMFYKILIDNDKNKDWDMVSGEIDFLEKSKNENQFVKHKIVVTVDGIDFVKKQMKETWQKIKSHEFTKGCGKEDCTWCNFVTANYTNITKPEEVDEI